MARYVAVQHGDIAVSDNPFGMLGEAAEIQPVDDAHRAVAAAHAEDGLQLRIVEQRLHQGRAVAVAASHLVVSGIETFGHHHLQPPRLQQPQGAVDLGGCNFSVSP